MWNIDDVVVAWAQQAAALLFAPAAVARDTLLLED